MYQCIFVVPMSKTYWLLWLFQEQLQPHSNDSRHASAALQRERNESYYEAIGGEIDSPDASVSGGHFNRGGRLRASLPIVKSPNRSLEKPLGE